MKSLLHPTKGRRIWQTEQAEILKSSEMENGEEDESPPPGEISFGVRIGRTEDFDSFTLPLEDDLQSVGRFLLLCRRSKFVSKKSVSSSPFSNKNAQK